MSLAFRWLIVFAVKGEFVIVVGRSTILIPHWSHGLKIYKIEQKGNGNRRWLEDYRAVSDLWVIVVPRVLIPGNTKKRSNN